MTCAAIILQAPNVSSLTLLPPFIDTASPASWCEQGCLSCILTTNCGSSLFFSARWRESFEKENRQRCLVVEVKPDETELLWVCFVCLCMSVLPKKKIPSVTLNSCPFLIGIFKSEVLLGFIKWAANTAVLSWQNSPATCLDSEISYFITDLMGSVEY